MISAWDLYHPPLHPLLNHVKSLEISPRQKANIRFGSVNPSRYLTVGWSRQGPIWDSSPATKTSQQKIWTMRILAENLLAVGHHFSSGLGLGWMQMQTMPTVGAGPWGSSFSYWEHNQIWMSIRQMSSYKSCELSEVYDCIWYLPASSNQIVFFVFMFCLFTCWAKPRHGNAYHDRGATPLQKPRQILYYIMNGIGDITM